MIRILSKYIFFILLSYAISQECGDNECDSQSETYINCIEDCPITVENLVWIDDIPVHVDDEYVMVRLNSVYLENLLAIQFEIEYDESVLELNVENCNGDDNSDCPISNSSLSYLTNSSNIGIIEGIVYSGMFFEIDAEFLNIKFDIIGVLGDSSSITINQFEINDEDIIDYIQNGLVTIGNFGCMNQTACNYSSEATFDDESCAYEYDCLGECGGNTIEDCLGECGGNTIEDCLGECNGNAIVDECNQCDGEMFIDEYGFYPDGACDCDGVQPYIYCIDNDGDGLGSFESSFSSCSEINQETLVDDCSDQDDSCIGIIDDCFVCDGGNLDKDCNGQCFGDAVEDCLEECNGNAITDECNECDGVMFIDEYGFYPDGSCDCDGTQPNEYCIDDNNDGISDFAWQLSCNEAPWDIFIDCQTLDIDSEKIKKYNLISTYPNPFNPSITIEYIINYPEFINIEILDLNGKYITNLISRIHTSGQHSINWSPNKNISSGIYLLKFDYGNETFVNKINYIK